MNKYLILFVFIFIFSGLSYAGEPQLKDFAKGIVLDCDNEASICKFTLPEQVYETLTRPDFGDMRMFNKDGDSVPFVLRHSEQKILTKESVKNIIPLAFYPVYSDEKKKNGGILSLYIAVNNQGALIETKKQAQVVRYQRGKEPDFYLVDTSQLEKEPERIEFGWNNYKNDLIVQVHISTSDDLDHWTTLVESAVIANIQFAGSQLKQKDVSLPLYHSKYLKVVVSDNNERVLFSNMIGHLGVQKTYEDEPRQWTRLTGVSSHKKGSDLIFSLKGSFPVDRIRLTFPKKNTLVHAVIRSKREGDKEWKPQYAGVLYSLNVKGFNFEKNMVAVDSLGDNRFSLTIDQREGKIKSDALVVEVGWLPHHVLFMAEGESPFTLAYGSGHMEPAENQMESLLSNLDSEKEKYLVKQAVMESSINLGGRGQLAKPFESLPWKKIVLWVIFLSCVGLCAGMAWTLYARMNSGNKP